MCPLACMRSNLEAKVLDLYKGESPRYGEIWYYSAPTSEPTWFLTIPSPIQKKTRESYAGLPLSEECLGGRRSETRRSSGFRRRKTTRTSESGGCMYIMIKTTITYDHMCALMIL